MRVLITGVAGHIGSRLAAYALREEPGTEIVGVDDLSGGYRENVPQMVDFNVHCASAVPSGHFDVVFHLAAYAAECMSPFVRRYNYENNLAVTGAVVSQLIDRGFKGRLVFASSIAAYGNAGGFSAPFDEVYPCTPVDPYGIAKHAAEQDIQVAGRQHGLDWCIVRPHNAYGPYQSIWQPHRCVLGIWMRAALEKKPLVIFGDGKQRRAFTYVDDLVPALWRAGTWRCASKRVINLGGKEPMSINRLAELVQGAVGEMEVKREPMRHELKDAWCTTQRSEELLQYRDSVPIERGIREMWDWAKIAWEEFPGRRLPIHLPVETRVGMPPSWVD